MITMTTRATVTCCKTSTTNPPPCSFRSGDSLGHVGDRNPQQITNADSRSQPQLTVLKRLIIDFLVPLQDKDRTYSINSCSLIFYADYFLFLIQETLQISHFISSHVLVRLVFGTVRPSRTYTADCKRCIVPTRPLSSSTQFHFSSVLLSDEKMTTTLTERERERESDWSFIYNSCMFCVCVWEEECVCGGLLIATVVYTTLISYTVCRMLFYLDVFFCVNML